jgi:hypothetical protein
MNHLDNKRTVVIEQLRSAAASFASAENEGQTP